MAGFCVGDVAAGGEFVPVWGVHAGTPEKVALTAGAMLDYASSNCWMCFFDSHGPVLEFESGIGGGRVNLGYTWWNLRSESGAQGAGMSLKASLLRTWGTPWAAEVDRTYAGVEAQIACVASARAAGDVANVGPARLPAHLGCRLRLLGAGEACGCAPGRSLLDVAAYGGPLLATRAAGGIDRPEARRCRASGPARPVRGTQEQSALPARPEVPLRPDREDRATARASEPGECAGTSGRKAGPQEVGRP